MTNADKPQGSREGWRLLETTYPFENEILKLRSDRVQIEGTKEITYTYMERAQAVIIVPISKNHEIVMIRQYRYPTDDWCLEVPAGGTHDTGDASLEEVAGKELEEEIGATFESLEYVTYFYSSNSLSDEKCHVYLVLGVELNHKPHTEETESIEMRLVAVPEALNLARTGQVKTGPCALALLLCEPALQRLGLI